MVTFFFSVSFMEFYFCRSLRRHGQSLEKVNREMVLAPLVGIILNLIKAGEQMECREHNDVVSIFASMGCLDSFNCRFQYLLDYDWVSYHKLYMTMPINIYIYTNKYPNISGSNYEHLNQFVRSFYMTMQVLFTFLHTCI